MDQIKRVKRVPHLYERCYQTAAGERRSKYYGIFTCKLKRKRRVFPLGGNLEAAKEALALLLADNIKGNGKDLMPRENTRKGVTLFLNGRTNTLRRKWTRKNTPAESSARNYHTRC